MKSFIKFFVLLLLTAYVLNEKAAVGSACTTGAGENDGCTDTNAECTGADGAKTCTCKANYEAEGTKCVLSLGKTCTTETCVANAECAGADGAKTCTCKTNYEAEGTKCVVSLGKTCAATDTCVANAECTGTDAKTCTCKTNYTAKNNKCESNSGTNTNNTNTNNDTSGSSFLKVFVISFLSLLF